MTIRPTHDPKHTVLSNDGRDISSVKPHRPTMKVFEIDISHNSVSLLRSKNTLVKTFMVRFWWYMLPAGCWYGPINFKLGKDNFDPAKTPKCPTH
jgi:hypothetical protein